MGGFPGSCPGFFLGPSQGPGIWERFRLVLPAGLSSMAVLPGLCPGSESVL